MHCYLIHAAPHSPSYITYLCRIACYYIIVEHDVCLWAMYLFVVLQYIAMLSHSLQYRMVYAVASLDSVLLYDTQHRAPFGYISNIHYAGITDLAWYATSRIHIDFHHPIYQRNFFPGKTINNILLKD